MGVPYMMWGEAVPHVVYVLNKFPTRGVKDMTPYEDLKRKANTPISKGVWICRLCEETNKPDKNNSVIGVL